MYPVYLGRKVGLFRPSVEFAVRAVGELDEPKASAFCEPKTSSVKTRGQKAR